MLNLRGRGTKGKHYWQRTTSRSYLFLPEPENFSLASFSSYLTVHESDRESNGGYEGERERGFGTCAPRFSWIWGFKNFDSNPSQRQGATKTTANSRQESEKKKTAVFSGCIRSGKWVLAPFSVKNFWLEGAQGGVLKIGKTQVRNPTDKAESFLFFSPFDHLPYSS